jgi:hypothetical protein
MRINGINPYVPVRATQAARLKRGWRKPMPVRIRLEGADTQPPERNRALSGAPEIAGSAGAKRQ